VLCIYIKPIYTRMPVFVWAWYVYVYEVMFMVGPYVI
jgi:hypothetical protein